MKSAKLSWIAAIAACTLLAIPIQSVAQCTRCCFPASNVTLNPSKVEKGQPIVLTTVVRNCGATNVIIAQVNLIPSAACASFAEAFALHAYVPAGQARTLTYTLSAPGCEGAYTVREKSSNAPVSTSVALTVY